MAVGTHRAQIVNGIEFVLFADLRERLEVVYMNEALSQGTVAT